jgi:hypothetical protein
MATTPSQTLSICITDDGCHQTQDIIALINTNGGNYGAACALDFSKPPKYYDTFALRDSEGHEHAMQTWPYFRAAESRRALKRSQPVPVSSCWNGIGVLSRLLAHGPLVFVLCGSLEISLVAMPASVFTGTDGVRFRGIDDSLADLHLEGSECCLVHADNPLSKEKGVYLNPNVRVGYNADAYQIVHPANEPWLSYSTIFKGLWTNRFNRWFKKLWIKEWKVLRLRNQWERQHPGRKEDGLFCLINEMQVLVHNGWAHV